VTTEAAIAARELCPLIARLRHDTEADRRLAEPIVARLRTARLCRIAIASEWHGLELPIPDALDVYEVLAGAEASVGWVVWNNSLPCLFGRYLERSARDEIFGDPAWLYAASTRPTGRAVADGDGYRVSGRWALVSGCELAEWAALLCAVEEDGAARMLQPGVPETRLAYVRRGDFEILDTWHVGGLRGTGSHDVVVEAKHVPRRWTVAPGDAVTLDAPIGRVPIICTMAAGYGAQTLGIARSAIDALVALTGTKVNVEPVPGLRERPAVLAAIARHTAALDAARAHLHGCAGELWRAACSGAPPALADVTAVWGAALHAFDAARSTVETMYAAGGTSSLYTDCPLERAHRDLHAMSRHIVAQTFWLEDAGRVRLGIPPTHPLYAV
jgi:alkylation response protein AidB-like acyl-CoA dehydrogenase